MQQFQLRIITENQSRSDKAEKLAVQIAALLEIKKAVTIERYPKLENSYEIIFTFSLAQSENSSAACIEITDRICSPWLVTYQRQEQAAELIFNKTAHAHFRNQSFNVIQWAHLELLQ